MYIDSKANYTYNSIEELVDYVLASVSRLFITTIWYELVNLSTPMIVLGVPLNEDVGVPTCFQDIQRTPRFLAWIPNR